MNDAVQQQSRLKALIAKGKEQGYLTYAEVNDHLPQDISDPDQVEDIIQMINDMGIQVFEQAPDADDLLMTEGDSSADDIAAAEAAAALAAVITGEKIWRNQAAIGAIVTRTASSHIRVGTFQYFAGLLTLPLN